MAFDCSLCITRCFLISPLETIRASLELSQTSELEHAKIRAFLIAGLCILITSKTNLKKSLGSGNISRRTYD